METQLIRAALLGPKVVTVCLFMKIFLGRTYDTIEAYLKSNPFVAQHLDVEELRGHSHSERNVELAEAAGLGIGEYGLEVNEYLQTSDQDIYAGGDLIEYEHLITKKPILGEIRPNTVIGGGG